MSKLYDEQAEIRSCPDSNTFYDNDLEDATGITKFRTIDRDGCQRIYDLGGRQLSAPVKGVNIINGQKVLINRLISNLEIQISNCKIVNRQFVKS